MVTNVYTPKNPITLLLSIWVIYLAILAGLQLSGLPFGFHVFAMGEDRNWISFITDSTGVKLVHKFWSIIDRNPLSPWVWLLVSPLIKMSDWSLYLIRKSMDPVLACMTFLLIDRLGKQQCRTFAFSVALVVLFWNFSAYYEQFIWCFDVALTLNILTMFFYCRYLDNDRKSASDLGLAMLCYMAALAIYTLQAGAFVAIAALAFFRNQTNTGFKTRFKSMLKDTSFFIALFIIYDCIWITVSTNFKVFYRFNWKIFFNQFSDSVHWFIFPPFYQNLWSLTRNDFSSITIASIFIASVLAICLTFSLLSRQRILDKSIKIPFLWMGVVLFTIAFPIVIVESTSSIWGPGSRSLMTYQVWQPMLYVGIIFVIANLIPLPHIFKRACAVLAIAILGSLAVLGGLDYNYRLVIRTHYQENLAKGLKAIQLPDDAKPYFLVRLKDPSNLDINTFPPVIFKYGQTLLHDDNVFLRVIASQPPYGPGDNWVVKFKADNTGVINAGVYSSPTPVPYKNLWIVYFDGEKVWVPPSVDKKDFEGLQVSWERNKPIDQTKLHGKFIAAAAR